MVITISVVGGLLFACFIFYFVFFILVKKKNLQLLEWSLLAMGGFYGLGFGLVIWSTFTDRNPHTGFKGILQFDTITVVTYLVSAVILLLSVVFGWYLMVGIKTSFNLKLVRYDSGERKKLIYVKRILGIAWFMLILSIVTYWMYAAPYGGFSGLLDHAKAIRAGVSTVNNPLSFFNAFGGYALFSSYIFFGDLINKDFNSKLSIIGFPISFLFSIYVLLSWAGRVSLAVFILTFILGFILYKQKSIVEFLIKCTTFSFLGLLFIVLADIIFGNTIKDKAGVVGLLSKELSFPFASYIAQVYTEEFRWFSDLVVAPLFMLPTRVWGDVLHIEPASSYNTLIVEGARKGEGSTGTIPVDMLTFGNLQASIIGVLIVGLLFGILLYLIEQALFLISNKALRSMIQANVILNFAVLSVIYSDPLDIISRNYHLICGGALIWLALRFKWKRSESCNEDYVVKINREEIMSNQQVTNK